MTSEIKKNTLVESNHAEWELLDASPAVDDRMFTVDELKKAMGFDGPVRFITECPPCATFARAPRKLGGQP